MDNPRVAVITGSSRGLGQALTQLLVDEHKFTVIITAQRNPPPRSLSSPNVKWIRLDLSNEESTHTFIEQVFNTVPHVDLLINNAATLSDNLEIALQVNVKSAIHITVQLYPLMLKSPATHPRIVNVSSGDGELLFFNEELQLRLKSLVWCQDVPHFIRLLEEDVLHFVYRHRHRFDQVIFNEQCEYKLSKALLNSFTQMFASLTRDDKVEIVAVCPGDVKTNKMDDDCEQEALTPGEAALRMSFLLNVARAFDVHGSFIRYGQQISW